MPSPAHVSLSRFPLPALGFMLVLNLTACAWLPAPVAVIAPGVVPSALRIEVTPPQALVDGKVSFQFLGFKPNQTITLVAEMRDHLDRHWQSYATFRTDNHGRVDIRSQQPISGTFNTSDPTGLFWSMHLLNSGGGEEMIPYLPITAQRSPSPITNYINYYGGTAAGDAFADADSWPQVLAFLSQSLR